MKFFEKHPMLMIIIGIFGISLSSILVRFSTAPSAVTAAFRLLWTVLLMSPAVFMNREVREEFHHVTRKNILQSAVSGLFLAVHFWLWFESLQKTSVASSTTIVCTEVIWVSIGYCLFMKGNLSKKAIVAILVSLIGSVLIAYTDSSAGKSQLYGDILSLLAAIAVAGYTLLGRNVRKQVSTTVYTYIVYAVCAFVLVLLSQIQHISLFSFGFNPILVGLLLALFSTILGHSVFSWCLKFFSPSFVSATKLCEPIVAAILAGFLFAEIPTALTVIGGILILLGVLLYSHVERNVTK